MPKTFLYFLMGREYNGTSSSMFLFFKSLAYFASPFILLMITALLLYLELRIKGCALYAG